MSLKKGREAEDAATSYLLKQGFLIVDRNVYVGKKEIDIVALKDNVLHFVEVKSGDSFEPLDNITYKKLSNLTYAIGRYMFSKKLSCDFMLDVIAVRGKNIEHLENVTF